MTSVPDERLQEIITDAKARIERVLGAPEFSPGMAEMNVFAAAGLRDLAQRTSAATKDIGADAVGVARRSLRETYRGRNPEMGWTAWVLLLAAIAAAVAAGFAFGARTGDPGAFTVAATACAVVSAVCEVIALFGSRFRPMTRGVMRTQIITILGLVIATALSFSNDLVVSAVAQACALGVAIIVVIAIVTVRARNRAETDAIDHSVERVYNDAVTAVEESAQRAQAQVASELDPATASALVRIRTAVFVDLGERVPSLRGFDPLAPAGAAIIGSNTDPHRWLPPAMAKTMER